MERWLSWSKAHAWKVCELETVPRVRIPLSPPTKKALVKVSFFVVYRNGIRTRGRGNRAATASLMDDEGSAQGLCCNTMKTRVACPREV